MNSNSGDTILEVPLDAIEGTIGEPEFSGNWIALPSGDAESIKFNFIHSGYGKTELVLKFKKTSKIQIRCDANTALINDSSGRIIAVELNTGTLLYDIRL